MTKYKQIDARQRCDISICLERGFNLTDTAKFIHVNPSTVQREILKHRELRIYKIEHKNICGHKLDCYLTNVCGNSKCTHQCSKCNTPYMSCNEYCPRFTKEPQCTFLKKNCNVCNGCERIKECKLNKWFYDSFKANIEHNQNNSSRRKDKICIKDEEMDSVVNIIKNCSSKNISLSVIKSIYPEILNHSVQTYYSLIDKGKLKGIDCIMLPRKVKYKPRKSQEEKNIKDPAIYINRNYDDFLSYITNNPYDEVVELDTVEGKDKKSFIMTLLFRKSNYMMAFKLIDHTASSIVYVFDRIKKELGDELFSKVFKSILTDRGSEFTQPDRIEFSNITGERLTRVFFCNPMASNQKGKIEKNHEELRKIFPKGFDFNLINQKELNIALSHINSYPRQIFNFKTPFELFTWNDNDFVLSLTNSKKINPKLIDLSRNLLKK